MILAVATTGRAQVADFPRSSSASPSYSHRPVNRWIPSERGSLALPPPGVCGREQASERAPLCIYPRQAAWDPDSEVFVGVFLSLISDTSSLSLFTSHVNLAKSLHLPEPHFPPLSNGGI